MPVHPMLVHVPIGCWLVGLVFDIASHVVAGPGFLTRGSTWLIAIGLITAVIAGLVGLFDAMPIPPGTPANRAAVIHLSLATLAVLIAATNLVLRLGGRDDLPVPPGELALSVATAVVLVVAGYYGALVAHRYGVGVTGGPQPRAEPTPPACGDAGPEVHWVRPQR
jgi:uncharacterized membrane protein